ncbi:MAG: hypothetical protein ACJA08_000374 [Cyclobacteriaceae bacterium]|jgi:hypothetical protein
MENVPLLELEVISYKLSTSETRLEDITGENFNPSFDCALPTSENMTSVIIKKNFLMRRYRCAIFGSLKLKTMRAVFIMILVLFLASCSDDGCRTSSITSQVVSMKIERLESALFNANSKAEILSILESNKSFSDLFLSANEYPDSEVLANKIFQLTKDEFIDTLYAEVITEFEDISVFESDMNDALGRLKTLFPEMRTPRMQTVVTGLYNDLYISDSLIIVGLDYFIGPQATFPPVNIPQYILRRYDKNHLPTTLIKFLSGPYISKGKNETLISEMIDFGKSFYLLSQLMPCTQDSILMGYSQKELKTAQKNHAVIWANLVENKILYETNHITKRKFLGERPNIYEISEECPGRIGAWIGWQIVRSYMSNNNVDIKDLIKDRDNDRIFRLSGYKPKG